MFENKRILAIIPARGGSKGIPHKNVIDLCGKPLIDYTIQAGLHSQYIDCVMVSTDDDEIAEISRKCGADVPFMRPAALAEDTSKTIDVVIHVIETYKKAGQHFDTLVLLQPTQPLRTSQDVDRAIEKYMEQKCTPLVSITDVDDPPVLTRYLENGKMVNILSCSSTVRRQDMKRYYKVNGCIYINEVKDICRETSFNDNPLPFYMGKDHSVDIDEPVDLAIAAYYLTERKK